MAKKKLLRFEEIKGFDHVIEPSHDEVLNKDHYNKGKWRKSIFKNDFPIVIELGCGKGEYCTGLAEKYPSKNFIGIDIKGERIWRGAKTVSEKGFKNVIFLRARIEFINSFFAKDEVSEIWITFPDPQRKKPKKRIISSRFLNMFQDFLIDDGIIHIKTDCKNLHNYNLALLKENGLKTLYKTDDLYSSEILNEELKIKTFYEKQFLEQGLCICYQKYVLPGNKHIVEPVNFIEAKH
ncbi:tRNA (guanosine(46)-N7)-methyltransferase TrmB [Bacteroidota bacterium]